MNDERCDPNFGPFLYPAITVLQRSSSAQLTRLQKRTRKDSETKNDE